MFFRFCLSLLFICILENGMTRNQLLLQVWDEQTMVGIIGAVGIVVEEIGLILVLFYTAFSIIVLLLLYIILFIIISNNNQWFLDKI